MAPAHQGVFGQRGASVDAPTSRPPQTQPEASAPESAHREPGLFSTLFGLGSSGEDEFDIRLQEEYAPGKTLWLIIPLWLLLGGFGAHRFYVGHAKMGLLLLGVNLFIGYMTFSSILNMAVAVQSGQAVDNWSLGALTVPVIGVGLWVFVDGVYVIVRKLSSR